MTPLAATLLFFLYWTAVGQATFTLSGARIGLLRSWLLAPGLGLAVNVLLVMIGNQAGIPVGHLARPMTGALAISSVAFLIWRRVRLPGRSLGPFCGAGLVFLGLAGWPFLRFGFHWASYVNDDYLNYSLAADRFRDFGFYRVPTAAELLGGDYTQYYWFMHVLELMRFGAEHVVAWASALLGVPGISAFMPAILALALSQIAAAAALVLYQGRHRRAAQLTAGLLAVSPLFLFGTIYQLLAQVGGLGLMMALVALLTTVAGKRSRVQLLRRAIPAAIVAAALAVFYPEVTPFGALTILICLGLELRRARRNWGNPVVLLEYTLIGMLLLLRHNLLSWIYTLAGQFLSGVQRLDLATSQFPFFLIPAGFSSLCGFQPLNATLAEPGSSILIMVGALLFVLAGAAALVLCRRAAPICCLLLVQMAVAAQLFRNGNDFGLYKLALYIQPALWGTLASVIAPRLRGRLGLGLALGAAGLLLVLPTALNYSRGSAEHPGAVLTELQQASSRLSQPSPPPPLQPGVTWAAGFDNVGGVKFAASIYRGGPSLRFLDRRYFQAELKLAENYPLMWAYPHRDLYRAGRAVLAATEAAGYRPAKLFDSEFVSAHLEEPAAAYLALASSQGLFNKLRLPEIDRGELFQLIPAARARNLVCFVNSSRGNLYYLGDRTRIALFQREVDQDDARGGIYGLGRFLLLRIDHPSDSVYLRLMLTRTGKGSGRTTWAAQGRALGENQMSLPLVGSGSANVFVGPIKPRQVDGAAYVALDFGENPVRFPSRRTGINALYHADIPLDYRLLVAFARDISALSPQEYADLQRPKSVSAFPGDLIHATGLEYSGIYEDSWISPAGTMALAAGRAGDAIRLRGFVPDLPGLVHGADLYVTVNGREYGPLQARPGAFDWVFPVPAPAPVTRVAWRSTAFGVLPLGDGRPVAAQLNLIALQPSPTEVAINAAGPRLPSQGVDSDGWAAAAATLVVSSAGHQRKLQLLVEYPGWPGVPPRGKLHVAVEGEPPVSAALTAGNNSIEVPAGPGLVQIVHLSSETMIKLPAPDSRERAFRLISIAPH